jgi:flagellin FlaB
MELKMPHKRDDRGQVGIGTLIVFIAMVLVAAIAAGVLINTAGFLQSQSEQTGQQSSSQVTNRLQVVNVVGESIGDYSGGDGVNPGIGVVNMTVKKAPGSEDVDLEGVTMQFVSNNQIVDLIHNNTAESGDTSNFATFTVQDDDTSIDDSRVLNDQTDRAIIALEIGDSANALPDPSSPEGAQPDATDIDALSEGQQVTVQITTASGGETSATLTVPETLSGKSAVSLAP